MIAKPILRLVAHSLLALTVVVTFRPRPATAADLPSGPGVAFAMVGVASGQTARITALNAGPGGPLSASGLAEGSCAGGVTLEFYGAAGELLKSKTIPNLAPGKTALLKLRRDELPKSVLRTEIRAVLRFGYAGGVPLSPRKERLFECNIAPSLEIIEEATGRTSLVLTDAKLLPGPNPPRK